VTSPILITGGTGTLGRPVVRLLRDAGHPVRVLSRRPHEPADGIRYVVGDLATGAGVDAAVDGVAIVAHCAGSAKGDADKARSLVRAAARAGVRHLVNISVVGADRVPVATGLDRAMFGYFAAKLAAERVVAESGVPWTTLRATQFHDLILLVVRQLAKLPLVPVPAGFRFQPVDSGEVAAALVALALGQPAGLAPDIAGPRAYGLDELIRGYLHATGRRRPIVPVPVPGGAARAIRAGANLPHDGVIGHRTWEEFLGAAAGDAPTSAAG
jgi:uncharacterized protein YbjT (DUF2867 family)